PRPTSGSGGPVGETSVERRDTGADDADDAGCCGPSSAAGSRSPSPGARVEPLTPSSATAGRIDSGAARADSRASDGRAEEGADPGGALDAGPADAAAASSPPGRERQVSRSGAASLGWGCPWSVMRRAASSPGASSGSGKPLKRNSPLGVVRGSALGKSATATSGAARPGPAPRNASASPPS